MISSESAKKLLEFCESPVYVFDETAFLENYHNFENTFKKHYGKYILSYSYKTNYAPYICKLVKENGGFAEVVSGMEYYIAEKIGYSPYQIIFNGPNKGSSGIDALLKGAKVNVDNLEELESYLLVAKEHPEKTFKVGLRVNIDVGQDFISRFGMDERDISFAFERVSCVSNLMICGLHCHIGRCRRLDSWRLRCEKMLFLADKYFNDSPPEYISLGSGMFGNVGDYFASQLGEIPSYEEYATVTAKAFDEHYKALPLEKKPILFTEPGTTVINKYVDFICQVNSIKRIKDKFFAQLNCSFHNLGETSTLVKLPYYIIPGGSEQKTYENLDFAGYTCLQQDIMVSDFCGALGVGDYIVFGNVGGYSNVFKPPFIEPQAKMVSLKANGDIVEIKRKETYEDVLTTYIF